MEELNYFDLVMLEKINADKESSVETFGSTINTSFFDTANMLGAMKVKGLIDFEQAIGGQSKLELTEKGKMMLEMAEEKAKGRPDSLDDKILYTVSEGISELNAIHNEVKVTPETLTFHIYRMVKKEYLEYYIRSGKIFLLLTEKGFKRAGRLSQDLRNKKERLGDFEKAHTENKAGEKKINEDAKFLMGEETSEHIPASISKKRAAKPISQSTPQTYAKKSNISQEEMQKIRRKSKIDFYYKKYKWLIPIVIIIIIGIIYLAVAYL